MRIADARATGPTTEQALVALNASVGSDAPPPSLAVVFYGASHDDAAIAAYLRERFPGTAFLGGTSCRGVMARGAPPDPGDIGLLTITDPDGDYGVGAAPIGSDAARAAEIALDAALRDCDCEGELPGAVWIYQPPGTEERVLEALRGRLGDRCPILGGSAADDDVTGGWRQLAHAGVDGPSVVIAVMFPSTPMAVSFQSGYAPGIHSGIVTATDGRTICTIDGQPAARVYDRWMGGGLAHRLGGGGVLAESSFNPLGVPAETVGGVVRHRLIHPARFTEDDGIDAFAEVSVGDTLVFMEGGADPLARRAGRTLSDAVSLLPDPGRFAGALMIYCGGCMLAIGDRIDLLGAELAEVADGKPILGAFTFGEQGPMQGSVVHGNLMVSVIAFAS